MNILLLTHYFAPENGAPQRRWSALIGRFVAAGHSVDVICPPPHYPSGKLAAQNREEHGPGATGTDHLGARVFRVSYLPHDGTIHTRTLDHLWVAEATRRKANRLIADGVIAPEVVIATAPALPTLVAGRAVAKRHGLPLVVEMRDAWPDLVSHTPGLASDRGPISSVKRLVHKQITSLQLNAARVVTTTETFAKVLLERGMRQVTVVRNGTDGARYAAVPPLVRDHAALHVLYMGTIGRSQGLEVLVRAAAKLKGAGVPLHVRLVGDGAAHGKLRELNATLGGPVEILRAVAGSEVLDHYTWADTCVVSLRDWEPFGWTVPSKLYELMAAGRHMTAIVAGESAALVREAASGDVVPPGDVDALANLWRELVADPSRLQIGDSGRAWVALHAEYESIADRYLNLLKAALA